MTKRFFIKLIRSHVNTSDLVDIYKVMEILRLSGRIVADLVPYVMYDLFDIGFGFEDCNEFYVSFYWMKEIIVEDAPVAGIISSPQGELCTIVVLDGDVSVLQYYGFQPFGDCTIEYLFENFSFSVSGDLIPPFGIVGGTVSVLSTKELYGLNQFHDYDTLDSFYIHNKFTYESDLLLKFLSKFVDVRKTVEKMIIDYGDHDVIKMMMLEVVNLVLGADIRSTCEGYHIHRNSYYGERGVLSYLFGNEMFRSAFEHRYCGIFMSVLASKYLHDNSLLLIPPADHPPYSCGSCAWGDDIIHWYCGYNIFDYIKSASVPHASVLDIIEWGLDNNMVGDSLLQDYEKDKFSKRYAGAYWSKRGELSGDDVVRLHLPD